MIVKNLQTTKKKKKLMDCSIIQIYITIDRTNLGCFEFSDALWWFISVISFSESKCYLCFLSLSKALVSENNLKYMESEFLGGSKQNTHDI